MSKTFQLTIDEYSEQITAESLSEAVKVAKKIAASEDCDRESTVWIDWNLQETRGDVEERLEAVSAGKRKMDHSYGWYIFEAAGLLPAIQAALPEATVTVDDDGDVDVTLPEMVSESGTVTLDPKEPKCDHKEGHDWRSPYSLLGGLKENPGVWGNGGGVICKEVCVRCGCVKTTDTWAQRMDTGEQGLTSVEYSQGDFDIDNTLSTIRWDGDIGSWCGRWFSRSDSESFDTKAEAQKAQKWSDFLEA